MFHGKRSEKYMESINVRHNDVTSAQRKLYDELAKSGRPNTLREHTRIAVEALVQGGASRSEAREIVAKSLKELKDKRVKEPTNIPWNKKDKGK